MIAEDAIPLEEIIPLAAQLHVENVDWFVIAVAAISTLWSVINTDPKDWEREVRRARRDLRDKIFSEQRLHFAK